MKLRRAQKSTWVRGLCELDIGTKRCNDDQENIESAQKKSESDTKRAHEGTCACCLN